MFSKLSSSLGWTGICLGSLIVVFVLSGYDLQLSTGDSGVTGHPTNVADGAEIYMTRCMSCHQMNGGGVPGVFPPLAGTEWVTGDKGTLIRVVLNGLTGKIDVNGDTYSGAMPPWGSFLDDEEMSQLLTYLRTSWNNDATEITPEEVAKVREAVADRNEPWTAEELKQDANRGVPGSK